MWSKWVSLLWIIIKTKARQPINFLREEDSKANEMRLILHLMNKVLIAHVRKQIMNSMTGTTLLTLRAEYGMVWLSRGNGALSAA